MGNPYNERIETLEEVTERLTIVSKTQGDRIVTMENNVNKYPKVQFPDYKPQFEKIDEQLKFIVKQQLNTTNLEMLDKKLDKAINSSPERLKAKWLMIYFGLVAFAAICFGVALGLKLQINLLSELLSKNSGGVNQSTLIAPQQKNVSTIKKPSKSRRTHQHQNVAQQ